MPEHDWLAASFRGGIPWRALGVYGGTSFAVLQGVDVLAAGLGLPGWVLTGTLILLGLGLPIVAATSWVQRGARRAGSEASSPLPAGRREAAAREPEPASGPSGAAPTGVPPSTAAPPSTALRLLRWRNVLLGGGTAFLALALLTAGWAVTRSLGIGPAGTLLARGDLESRSAVLVVDFTTSSLDVELGRAAAGALRVDLAQSPLIDVVEPARVADALRRMQRSPDAPLDPALAREVALREGIPALVSGNITSAGDGYMLFARLVRVADERVLASHRENAGDEEDVIAAIDRLSHRLRERIGEPLRSLRAEEPLARVTTSSLHALQLYSRALAAIELQGDWDRGAALLREAVAEDTAFASAWRKLGVVLGNGGGDRREEVEALTRAYRHRDRLTETERRHATAMYHWKVEGEAERAAEELTLLLEEQPDDGYALNNLGVIEGFLRRHARAESLYVRAARTPAAGSAPFVNAVTEQVAQGRVEAARATLDAFEERFPENVRGPHLRAMLAAATGDYAAAEAGFRDILDRSSAGPPARAEARRGLALLAAVRGRMTAAEAGLTEVARIDPKRARGGPALLLAADAADLRSVVGGDRAAAFRRLEEALGRTPLASVEPSSRPYDRLAGSFALAGAPRRARALMAARDAEVPPELQSPLDVPMREWALGEVLLAEGRVAGSIAAFRRADVGYCELCALEGLARAWEAAGVPDSAEVAYGRYLETPSVGRLEVRDFLVRGRVLERLGRLREARGDPEGAARLYGELAALWAEADPPLRARPGTVVPGR